MKSLATLSMLFLLSAMYTPCLEAQIAGDYQTKASTAWQLASTWETYDGATWIPAVAPPSAADGNILIKAGHTVICSTAVTVDQLLILGNLHITSAGILNLADGTGEDAVIGNYVSLQNGQINGPGTVTVNAGATLQLSAGGNSGAGTISTSVTNGGTILWSNSTGGGTATSILTLTGGSIVNNGAFSISNTGGPISHRINNGDIVNNNNITYTSAVSGVQMEFLVNKFTNNAGATVQDNASGKLIIQAVTGDTHEGQFVSTSTAGIQFKGAATQVYGTNSNFSGAGPFDFNAGSHTFNGSYNATITNITGATTVFNQVT
jgi:hypothetical protein